MASDLVLAQAIQSQTAIALILGILAFVLIASVLGWLAKVVYPKSKQHRELVTDLYVIGTIRKFAEKDGIDLQEEMKGLKQIERWERMNRRSLDYQIEADLKEKVAAENQLKIDEMSKGKENKETKEKK